MWLITQTTPYYLVAIESQNKLVMLECCTAEIEIILPPMTGPRNILSCNMYIVHVWPEMPTCTSTHLCVREDTMENFDYVKKELEIKVTKFDHKEYSVIVRR